MWDNLKSKATLIKGFSLKQTLADGSIYSGLMSSLIIASLYYDKEIWYNDLPKEVREKAGPMSERARRNRLLVTIPFFAITFGYPIYSNLRIKRRNKGRQSYGAAFLNTYLIYQIFNLVDTVGIDYLFLMKLQPGLAVLPGTEGMTFYKDTSHHIRSFFKGWLVTLIPSLLLALVTGLKRKKQDNYITLSRPRDDLKAVQSKA
jgi:hypothetical protein